MSIAHTHIDKICPTIESKRSFSDFVRPIKQRRPSHVFEYRQDDFHINNWKPQAEFLVRISGSSIHPAATTLSQGLPLQSAQVMYYGSGRAPVILFTPQSFARKCCKLCFIHRFNPENHCNNEFRFDPGLINLYSLYQ